MTPSHPFVPVAVRESLDRYVNQKIATGSFLQAVLENDLREAVGRADSTNLLALCHIVTYCYNELPSTCWGSPERVRAWLKKGG